jgi:hypothetical protein
MGHRAVLDMVVKRIIPSPCQESNPRTLISILKSSLRRHRDLAQVSTSVKVIQDYDVKMLSVRLDA